MRDIKASPFPLPETIFVLFFFLFSRATQEIFSILLSMTCWIETYFVFTQTFSTYPRWSLLLFFFLAPQNNSPSFLPPSSLSSLPNVPPVSSTSTASLESIYSPLLRDMTQLPHSLLYEPYISLFRASRPELYWAAQGLPHLATPLTTSAQLPLDDLLWGLNNLGVLSQWVLS